MSIENFKPPFCAVEAEDLACPHCGEVGIQVREKEVYYEGDSVDAYCTGCQREFTVIARIDVTFTDPEKHDGD